MDAGGDALQLEARLRRAVASDHDHVGSALQQPAAEVRADQPVGAGDEHRAPAHRLPSHPVTPAVGEASHGAPAGSAS